MNKIFLVSITSAMDFESSFKVHAFSNEKSARVFYDTQVELATHDMSRKDYSNLIVENSNDSHVRYIDGEYSQYHIAVYLEEVVVND